MRTRFKGIEKVTQITNNPEEVDVKNNIFLADPNIEDKMDSGDAVWCYFRRHFWPWRRKHTEAQARDIIMNLTPGLQAQTDKLIRIIAQNQSICASAPTAASSSTDIAPAVLDESESAFKLLRDAHLAWKGSKYVRGWMVNKASWIQTISKGTDNRLTAFRVALDSRRNFFFDCIDDDNFVRAPFNDIGELCIYIYIYIYIKK